MRRPSSPPLHLALAVLAAAVLSAHPGVARSGGAQSGGARLVVEPAAPVAGEPVSVRYRPGEPLAVDRVVLRARLRTPRHDSYNLGFRQTTVAELRRGPGGEYVGEFRLPGDVVYAVFGVETPLADRADDNGGRPWELLVHGADGRPLYEALFQRFHDHMGRDKREVLSTARRATELYPDLPGGWSLLNAAESWSAGAAEQAEARERRRERSLRVAARIAARGDLTPDEVSEMAWVLSGTPEAAEWRDRLERDHPGHAAVIMSRMFEARSAHRDDPAGLLARLEELWAAAKAAGPPANVREEGIRADLAASGVRAAAADGRDDLLERWADRFRMLAPADRQITTFLGTPRLREAGVEVARGEIARLRELRAEDRLLGQTLDEQRAAHLVAIGQLQGRIGQALVEAGRLEEGAAELRDAVVRVPATLYLRTLGDAELRLGDAAAALDAWARLAAHPATPAAFGDTSQARLGDAFNPTRWAEVRAAAHGELVRMTRERAVRRPLPPLELATRTGERRPFQELTDGARAAVVVFVSRHCGPSTQAMPRIQELARELARRDVVVLPVTQDPTGEDYPETLTAAGVDIPVWHDVTGDVSLAFNVWGTPQYYVIDRDGVIRYERTWLVSIPLELDALLGVEAAAPVSEGAARP
jgi:peroxiredoxin